MVLGLFVALLIVAMYGLSLVAQQSVESEVKLAPQKVYIDQKRIR
jgi:Na+-transporting methylmalonyl-CoA/oxaloacetate decarboxylase gamma subunit